MNIKFLLGSRGVALYALKESCHPQCLSSKKNWLLQMKGGICLKKNRREEEREDDGAEQRGGSLEEDKLFHQQLFFLHCRYKTANL